MPPTPVEVDWQRDVAALWQRHALGGSLTPVPPRDAMRLDDLLGIERQKQALVDNTRAFLQGYPANHALLWGARGGGKSSLVRALLNDLAEEGLRLVQVDRHDLAALPVLVERLRREPHRFVVYCDDLSFEGHDDAYKALKSVLDGTLTGPPENVLLYATSNRRHLLPESMSDNDDSRWWARSCIMRCRGREDLAFGSFRPLAEFSPLRPGDLSAGLRALGDLVGRRWRLE